jgi:thiol-disulfide isomerase/thioredoxin
MTKKMLTPCALLLATAALAACGSGDSAGNPDSELSLEQASTPLEGASPPLAEVRSQANELLEGGTDAFTQRLAALEGSPIVINKWASWCGPCRFEFPSFQSQALKRGGEVAFLGVGANDSEDALATFLEELPLPYPTYLDPDQEIASEIEAPVNFPATAFYDSGGELVFTHQGVYEDEAALAADIERYAN